MKYYILYNSLANNKTCIRSAESVKSLLEGNELAMVDIAEASRDYPAFFANIGSDDKVVICGGDGTINRFINESDGADIKCEILYYAGGSGNDFYNDIKDKSEEQIISLDPYIKDLPVVEVGGKTYRFLNGIGYGIDGYCCEVGDELRSKASDKPINYTGIAIKGLLFHYKPTNAVVTVDGVRHEYKKVWLAPTMNGRFYGGGMMPTPEQDRLDPERKLSVLVWHGSGKIGTLIAFPSLFKGEHLKNKNMCEVLTGKSITVEFDRPVAAQIDGETVLGVSSYTAKAYAKVKI